MKFNNDLTFEEVDALLSYCLITGLLRWKVYRSQYARAGDIAGYNRKDGYIQIKINGKKYLGHRVAWLLTHGEWPDGEIDHKDGVRDNNRIINLREVTRTGNCRNKKKHSNNTSGFTGVLKPKDCKSFRGYLYVNGKKISKNFKTQSEALAWRIEQERKHRFTPGHGLEQDQREQLHKFVRRAGK